MLVWKWSFLLYIRSINHRHPQQGGFNYDVNVKDQPVEASDTDIAVGKGAGLTFEIFGILLGSIVLLFFVMGTVFQVSSLCMR